MLSWNNFKANEVKLAYEDIYDAENDTEEDGKIEKLKHISTDKGRYAVQFRAKDEFILYRNKKFALKESNEFDPFCVNHAFKFNEDKDSSTVKGNLLNQKLTLSQL
jgi:5-hydroxyisourate hydrolase-like protein (transthyretin family)